MPQITSGSNATFSIANGYVVDIQCPGGWIQFEYPVGTKVFEGNPAGRTFGPYAAGTAKLTSVKGDIYYEVDPTPSANVPFDPSGVAVTGGSIVGARVYGAPNIIAGGGDSLVGGAAPGCSPYNQAFIRATMPYRSVGNFAVAGTRTDQIATQIPQAAAAGASIMCINGGVNDIVQGIPETTLRANLIANWNACRALGMEPVSIGLPPTNTAANVPRYALNEVWRKLYCRKNNIRHVDEWTPMATGAGAYQTGLFLDAIHYNSAGAYLVANRLMSILDGELGRYPTLLAMTDTGSDVGSFVNNAVSFAGGATPTGWFSTGTGGTLSVTAADSGDMGSWLRCTVSAGTNAGFTPTAVTLASLGWSVGDRLAIGFRIRWSDTSQALALSVSTTGITSVGNVQPLFNEKGGPTGSSITIYSEQVIASGTTIGMQFTGTGTGWFEVNRPVVVNLTQLGFPNGVV